MRSRADVCYLLRAYQENPRPNLESKSPVPAESTSAPVLCVVSIYTSYPPPSAPLFLISLPLFLLRSTHASSSFVLSIHRHGPCFLYPIAAPLGFPTGTRTYAGHLLGLAVPLSPSRPCAASPEPLIGRRRPRANSKGQKLPSPSPPLASPLASSNRFSHPPKAQSSHPLAALSSFLTLLACWPQKPTGKSPGLRSRRSTLPQSL